jgi:hypothetical protein
MSHRYGFGTYIHFIHGYLSKDTNRRARACLRRLVKLAGVSRSNVYMDTLVVPSITSAIAQIVQLPGISGKDNNTILFEYSKDNTEDLLDIIDNYHLVRASNFDTCILACSEKAFGYKREIHIWITSRDYENANLMILLGFIILGHPDWGRGFIRLFAVLPEDQLEDQKRDLLLLVKTGRLPIAAKNITFLPQRPSLEVKQMISQHSADADLTLIGFRGELLRPKDPAVFGGYEGVGNILFVNSTREKEIK